MAEDLVEKKLRGSGGYVIARVTDEEQKKANLGGSELFLAGIGRLEPDRFSKYHCNKCEKDYDGSPAIVYENPNEQLGEGVTLLEKGEYKCKTCSSTLAQYRKFDAPAALSSSSASVTNTTELDKEESGMMRVSGASASATRASTSESGLERSAPASETVASDISGDYFAIESLVGMPAYDSEAMLVGNVKQVGLRKVSGNVRITVKIGETESDQKEIIWERISKIGDIILLSKSSGGQDMSTERGMCSSCGHQNEDGAAFCEDCGKKLL